MTRSTAIPSVTPAASRPPPRRRRRPSPQPRPRHLLTALDADEKARKADVPDLVAFMLATGCRLGEAAAVTWDVLDLDAGTVEISSTVGRVTGQGLILQL